MAFHPRSMSRRHQLSWLLRRGLFAVMLAAMCIGGMCRSASTARAHGSSEETTYHSLTLVLGFPDAGLEDTERLCLDIFTAQDTSLATPIQASCLSPGEKAAVFDGLPHGSFQIAVPGGGSTVTGDRYAGKVVQSDIPDDPEVDAYIIDLSLSLVDAAAGTTGSLGFAAFLCPPSVAAGDDLDQWVAACPDRIGGVDFTVASEGSLAATTAAAATGSDGQAVVSGLPAGLYRANEGPLAGQVQETVWFATSSFDGVASRLDAGASLSLRPAESVSVAVFHVMAAENEPPVSTGPVASPVATVADLPAPEQITGAQGSRATETAGGADITPFISVGQQIQSGPAVTPEPGPPLHPDIIATITTLPATGTDLPSSNNVSPIIAALVVSGLVTVVGRLNHRRSSIVD
jgi:hypothetical protein